MANINYICHIFRDSHVDVNLLTDLSDRLKESFSIINLKIPSTIHVLDPDKAQSYVKKRRQFKADCLVENCVDYAKKKNIIEDENREICLYLLNDDAFDGHLNFVFGLAKSDLLGCMVSLYRLDQDEDFVLKECVHEIGHVFKLKHCKLPCVMTFSNSVDEAREKNLTFCAKCQTLLKR